MGEVRQAGEWERGRYDRLVSGRRGGGTTEWRVGGKVRQAGEWEWGYDRLVSGVAEVRQAGEWEERGRYDRVVSRGKV